jgi:hypothetical protein
VQASGLESGLVGVGLLSVLLQLSLPGVGTTKRWLVLGAACGALFLARVALLPGVALVGLFVLRRDGRRAALIWGLGALAVSLPWLVFAWVEFGQALPVSGTRKLVGAPAGLARFLADLPGVPDRWPRALLDPGEAALFDHPDLPAPSWGAFWALGIRATGGWALGHWLPAGAGLTTGLAGLGALALGAAGAVRLVGRRLATPPAPPPTLWLLAALALANGALHHLLLPGYVHYGYWYRLPELLLVVILTAWAVAPLLRGPGARWAWAGLVALVGVGALHAGQDLRPRAFDPEAYRTAIAVMTVAEGMNRRLPRGTLVGAWNAGLLGWLADGPVVVNLDGLANSREFVPVARDEVYFRHGLSIANPTLGWLDAHGIRALVDLHPIEGLGATPFYDLIPVNRYAPELRSAGVSRWARPGRDHCVALVRLLRPLP